VNTAAILLLSVVPTYDPGTSVDDLNKAVTELKSGESKLKSTYQDVMQGYKKTGPILKQIRDAAHDIEVLNAQLLAISGQGQNYNGRRAEENAKNSLRNRIKDLEKTKGKLETDLKSKQGPVDELESAFKEEEKKAWEAANKTLVPLLYVVKIGDDRKTYDSVMSVFDLFIFDDHKDAPYLISGWSGAR
jgi:hypothetical protein